MNTNTSTPVRSDIDLAQPHRVRIAALNLRPGDVFKAAYGDPRVYVAVHVTPDPQPFTDIEVDALRLEDGAERHLTLDTDAEVKVIGFLPALQDPGVPADADLDLSREAQRAPRPRAYQTIRATVADDQSFWARAARLEVGDRVEVDTPDGRRQVEITATDDDGIDDDNLVTIEATVQGFDPGEEFRFTADGDTWTLVFGTVHNQRHPAGAAEALATVRREPFRVGYDVETGVRIHRVRLAADRRTGVAEAAFDGQTLGLPWVERGEDGRAYLYSEVDLDADVATTYRVAMVPTGKRTPRGGTRLGSAGRFHAYLLNTITQARPQG